MKYLFFLVIVLCASVTAAYSQPGTLDKSFGEGGIVTGENYSTDCNDLITQKDGKIISIGTGGFGKLTGGLLLVRYNTDGTPDLSFGDSGRVASQIDPRGTYGFYGAVQEDGKIVVAGYVPQHGDGDYPLVVRYNANGAIDSSFGTNGIIIEPLIGIDENPCGIVIQPDGKIITAGSTADAYKGINTLYIIRYNKDGSHDESFGNKGIYQEFDLDPITAGGLALQPDGKIIVGGDYEFSNNYAFFLKKYATDGSPDTKFGVNGEARYNFADPINSTYMYSIALQPDGKIVAAGSTYTSYFTGNATVVRFNADGSTDQEFGKKGSVITTLGSNTGLDIKKIAIQANGNMIAGARTYDGYPNTYNNFASIQYTSDGNLDLSFGTNGIQITSLEGQSLMNSLALQKDGKYILGGYNSTTSPPYTYHTILIRYNGDDNKQPLAVRIKRWLLHHGISWQMQPNKDVRYYAVQRSADGIVYKEIAKLSNKQQVDKYEDAATITGSSYYRLAAVGWDGSRTYSNTVLIDESSNVKVFPNPVRDNLQLQGLATGKTTVSIVDLQGNVRSSSVAAGSNYSINTANLNAGNYLLKLQHNNTTTTQPFVKE